MSTDDEAPTVEDETEAATGGGGQEFPVDARAKLTPRGLELLDLFKPPER